MKRSGISVKGYTIKDGKLVRILGYRKNASQKIAERKNPKRKWRGAK